MLALSTVVENAAAWLALLASVALVGGKVWKTCSRVLHWVDQQEDRYQAVDAVVADWHSRGLTPDGAIREQSNYRKLVNVHTGAISDVTARVDKHDERLQATEEKLDHITLRVDEIAESVK